MKGILSHETGSIDENGHFYAWVDLLPGHAVKITITETGILIGDSTFLEMKEANSIHHDVIVNVARKKFGK